MSRFATLSPWIARAVLALIVIALAGSVALVQLAPRTPPATSPRDNFGDHNLYKAITRDVRSGQNYYAAAAHEQRIHGYPTRPAMVFREPALTYALAGLPSDVARRAMLSCLGVLAGVAIWRAMVREGVPPRYQIWAVPITATGLLYAAIDPLQYFHEAWAGVLIAMSLAVYRKDRWLFSVLLGALACVVRELAVPYLLAMGAFALLSGARREASGWLAGLSAFAAVFAVHLHIASGMTAPGDLPSQGWLALGGPMFALHNCTWNPLLILAPAWVVAVALGLSLLGLAATRNPLAARGTLILAGYIVALCLVGRPQNFYWGLIFTPIFALGLALAPLAIAALVGRALPALSVAGTSTRLVHSPRDTAQSRS